jgi:hypothetical protein
MAKRTVYIVSKIGWEYNDENYYRPESEGGMPVKAYSTREKAQAEVDKLNAPLLKNTDDDYYKREATYEDEKTGKVDEYGLVNITEDYEVIAVELED